MTIFFPAVGIFFSLSLSHRFDRAKFPTGERFSEISERPAILAPPVCRARDFSARVRYNDGYPYIV